MQNANVVSKPEFTVLSNGALVFAVSLISGTGNGYSYSWKLILHLTSISAVRTQLTGKQSAPFERAENSGLETLRF
jgi:hypothetical protein